MSEPLKERISRFWDTHYTNEWKQPENMILMSTAVCILVELMSYFEGIPAWAPVVVGLITTGHFYREYKAEHPESKPCKQASPNL